VTPSFVSASGIQELVTELLSFDFDAELHRKGDLIHSTKVRFFGEDTIAAGSGTRMASIISLIIGRFFLWISMLIESDFE